MLVLSRQRNESIVINEGIEVTVVDIRGDKVRLGIVTPQGMTVHRREVWEAITRDSQLTKPASAPAESPGASRSSPSLSPMLVLSRKRNESVVINGEVTIVVVDIRGDKVRLGVEAPLSYSPHRREVWDALHRHESEESAG